MAIKASNTITLIRVDDGQDGDPTGVTESATVPANPYSGMLWKCTGTLAGYQQNAIYRWNGSKWELFFFSAVNIKAETLSAITANLGEVTAGTLDGLLIKGSEFKNDYQYTETSGTQREGSFDISLGALRNDYTSTSGLEGFFHIDRDGNIVSAKNQSGQQSQYELTPDNLIMTGNGYLGSITSQYASQINAVGKKLWTGAWHLTANQTVTPTTKLSDCLNGWIIEFQGYSNGAATNGDFSYVYVPKIHATEHSGRVISAIICGHGGGIFRKILYVSNTQITGHANNNVSPANTAVMSGVYAF